jgi:hypothetical protein
MENPLINPTITKRRGRIKITTTKDKGETPNNKKYPNRR